MLIFAQPICYFNPLPRKEGDAKKSRKRCLLCNFNPLPRKEGDAPNGAAPPAKQISIRSLVKRETIYNIRPCHSNHHFNPLPRKEGDAAEHGAWTDGDQNFNPLPRKEGDSEFAQIKISDIISIRSLVKRETARIADASLGHGFQSAPS